MTEMLDESDHDLAKENEANMIESTLSRIRKNLTPAYEVARDPYCETCGDEIPGERLRAVPNAVRCVPCQGMLERGR